MLMNRISPRVRVVLAIVVPLSFLFLRLKRLRSRRGPTPAPNDAAHSEDDEMETTNTEGASPAGQEYDVFLSFRGGDTRSNFVSHLYDRLIEKGIHTFKDDRELERGKPIESALYKAIKTSRIVIVVFSEKYADSSWCLDELIEIVEWKKVNDQLIILPVFYKISTSDVQEQTGAVAEAFSEHEKKFEDQKIQRWKKALSEVSTISGWGSSKCFDEADLIKSIVRDVSKKLNCGTSPPLEDLIGIDSHVSWIENLLDFECNDVRIIGIWGIGGIGKTTIANSVFHKHSNSLDPNGFHSSCFLENVRDKHGKGGSTSLQMEFLDQLLGGFDTNIRTVVQGRNLIHNRLCRKKVFIVLDDADDIEQLNALIDSSESFGHGSRIIITTRDKHLLNVKEVHYIHEVQPLNPFDSLRLFCKHAFKQSQPKSDFYDLSNSFVTYAQGLPLALKVLGTFLNGLEKHEWQGELEKLKRFSNPDIYQVLKVSYDGLKDSFVRNVFLDIAFFFVGEDVKTIENVLCEYGCSPSSAIRTLKDRALMAIDDHNVLSMHDKIQEMAHEIVKEESKSAYKRSRLLYLEDISSLMNREEMEEKKASRVEGISLLDISKIDKKIYMKPNAFKKLCHLRILKFGRLSFYGNQLDYLPPELWYLRWDFFPFNYWPSTFSAKHLVELRLRWSKLESLWSGELELENLKVIDLSYSGGLKTFPNLSRATNIEEIYLDSCESLIEFSSDLQHLKKLTRLRFSCKKLNNLPDLPPNLLHLRITGTTMTKCPLEVKLLNFECSDSRKIAISGLFGVGKTTFAKSIFNKCSGKFDYSCYLQDVSFKLKAFGEISLLRELLKKNFDFDGSIKGSMVHALIGDKFRNQRILIVLDDVDNWKRLDYLFNSFELFGRGSRIIIATRHRQLIEEEEAHYIYDVGTLDYDESLELFSRHAFKQDQPPRDFLGLSNDFVHYARGQPLSLRLLGGLLYGLEIHEWQSEYDKLDTSYIDIDMNIYQLWRLSYEGLKDDFVKEVFLDIAYFFIGKSELKVQEILDRYDGMQKDAIRILKDRGLITIDSYSLLRIPETAREVTCEFAIGKSKYPWVCSRLPYEKMSL